MDDKALERFLAGGHVELMNITIDQYNLGHLLTGPIIDLGCGYGNTTIALQRTFSRTPIIGIDIMELDLRELQRDAPDVPLVCADIAQLPIRGGSVPLVFSAAIYDYFYSFTTDWPRLDPSSPHYYRNHPSSYHRLLREIHRILRPGGVYFSIDYEGDVSSIGNVLEEDLFLRVVQKRSTDADHEPVNI